MTGSSPLNALAGLDAAITELEGALAGDDLSRIEGAVARLRDALAGHGPDALRGAGKDAVSAMDRRLRVVEGLLFSKLADPSAEAPATYTIGRLRKNER